MDRKRIISINLGNYGSTGNITKQIKRIAAESNMDVTLVYPGNAKNTESNRDDIIICSDFINKVNQKLAYYSGLNGYFAFFTTIRMLNKVKKLNPDIIHLHNLHNSYINLSLLFRYIKKNDVRVVWTLHDCWSFTGKCPHFSMIGCSKWKNGCSLCPQVSAYPHAKFDFTNFLWKQKKQMFCGVNHMILVTPSNWLRGLLKDSFLKEYDSITIYNGVDTAIFRPYKTNYLREKYNIPEKKKIILGVSFVWSIKKGIDVFIDLSKQLDENQYQIVLVGVDKDQIELPTNIITIGRTNNQNELAQIYSSADVFVNPTREEVLGLVNIESLACGTPVVTFNSGGSPECIDESCGIITKDNNVEEVLNAINNVLEKNISNDACVLRAKCFLQEDTYRQYISLYKRCLADV